LYLSVYLVWIAILCTFGQPAPATLKPIKKNR
jgi:hypothetical protein